MMDKNDPTQFTPGPWEIKSTGLSTDITAKSKRGKTWTIARTTAAKVGREQAEANARLIVMAPKLYSALKLLHDNMVAYITINKLGDPHHSQDMKEALIVLTEIEDGRP